MEGAGARQFGRPPISFVKRLNRMKLPATSFFLVGAPRCGTTSLAWALAQHPEVCFSEPKEPHFFSRIAEDLSLPRLERDYIGVFFRQEQLSRRALGEGSPSYLYSLPAIGLIDRFFPDARFLVMVRNPLEMMPSYHARLLFTMDEDVSDFEKAWRLQGLRARGQAVPRGCRDAHMLQYAEVGRMGAHIAGLLDCVRRDRVKIILLDDFAREPRAAYRGVLDFLGLTDDGRTEFARMSGTKRYRSALIHRLVTRPPDLIARLVHDRLREPAQRPSPLRLLRRLRKSNVVLTEWCPIGATLREEIAACFRDDVALLGRLLGRDLRHWLEVPEAPATDARPAAQTPPVHAQLLDRQTSTG